MNSEPMRIGIISDTHSLLRPEVVRQLQGVHHILHAGDVGDERILTALGEIAPVTAIRGNVDVAGACGQLPATEVVELGGCLFYLVHAIQDMDINPSVAGIHAVVYGHSHRAEIRDHAGIVYINPGSAGPRRFDLPITLAHAIIENGAIHIRIVELG